MPIFSDSYLDNDGELFKGGLFWPNPIFRAVDVFLFQRPMWVFHPATPPFLFILQNFDEFTVCSLNSVLFPQWIWLFLYLKYLSFGLQEGETIRINVKHKASGGTGMLSAAGLTGGNAGTPKPKVLSLAPPPSGAGKIRSPLPPPPNDPVAARIASTARSSGDKGTYEGVRHSTDSLSDLSQLQVCWSCLFFWPFPICLLFVFVIENFRSY